MPCSRATPRSSRSSGALPHSPSPWSASDSTVSGTNRTPVTGSGAGLGLQLPVEPVDQVGRTEPPRVSPGPRPRSSRSHRLTSTVTLVQTRPWWARSATHRSAVRREEKTIGSIVSSGGSKCTAADDVHRRPAAGHHPDVQAARQPVPPLPVPAEPGQHVSSRQGGEVTEGADSEPPQQADHVGVLDDPDRQAGQERRRRARRDDQTLLRCGPASRLLTDEDAVGHPDPAVPHADPDELLGQYAAALALAAVEAARHSGRAQPGPDRARGRGHVLDRRQHLIEVAQIALGAVVDDDQLGAVCGGVPLAHAPTYALRLGPAGEQASTAPLATTAIGTLGGSPASAAAAITGQSGHQITITRVLPAPTPARSISSTAMAQPARSSSGAGVPSRTDAATSSRRRTRWSGSGSQIEAVRPWSDAPETATSTWRPVNRP